MMTIRLTYWMRNKNSSASNHADGQGQGAEHRPYVFDGPHFRRPLVGVEIGQKAHDQGQQQGDKIEVRNEVDVSITHPGHADPHRKDKGADGQDDVESEKACGLFLLFCRRTWGCLINQVCYVILGVQIGDRGGEKIWQKSGVKKDKTQAAC
jgi:hypothetical protein